MYLTGKNNIKEKKIFIKQVLVALLSSEYLGTTCAL